MTARDSVWVKTTGNLRDEVRGEVLIFRGGDGLIPSPLCLQAVYAGAITPALSVISVSLSITSIEKSKSSSMPPFAVAFATCSLVRASPVPTSEITTDLPSVNALPAHGTITNHSSCLETFCRTKSRLSITAEYLPAARPVSLRYLANVKARAGSVGASVS